jgi:hypothetical protein
MYTRSAFQLARDYFQKVVAWDCGEAVEVYCKVIDGRVIYGRELLLIRPVCGEGQKWVRASKCRITGGTEDANETQQSGADSGDLGGSAAKVPQPNSRRKS